MFKKLLVILVALLAIGGTASAYAWWDTLEKTETASLTIGEGETLVVGVTTQATTDRLVPTGVVMKTNDVTSIVFTYSVKLDQTATNPVSLDVTYDNLTLDTAAYGGALLNIDVTPNTAIAVNGTDVDVVVTITLAPDAQGNDYSDLVNGVIAFDLLFDAR